MEIRCEYKRKKEDRWKICTKVGRNEVVLQVQRGVAQELNWFLGIISDIGLKIAILYTYYAKKRFG